MLGTLYAVATPIGNLTDISQRAIETLKLVDLVLCEDTRVTKKLMRRFNIETDILSYHHHSSEKKKWDILAKLTRGVNLALVSDAGTPGISDPGNELIDFVLERAPKIRIVPVPGVSAMSTALSVCGFRVNRFVFAGFLPKKGLGKFIAQINSLDLPLVFFESPRRIIKTLSKLEELVGSKRRVFVGRELTKLHETYRRGQLSEVRAQLLTQSIKGEFVVVLEGE